MPRLETVRVAAVQATPVILDREATAEKVVRLLGEAPDGVTCAPGCTRSAGSTPSGTTRARTS